MISRECFINNIKVLEEIYNKKLTREAITIYKKVLDEKMNDDTFEKGCSEVLASKNKFFPRPGEIIEASKPTKDSIESKFFNDNLKKMGLI